MKDIFRQKLLLIGTLLFSITSIAQRSQKIIISQQDPHELYADGQSRELFYEIFIPANHPVGTVVILPGSGELISDVQKQITLHTLAVKKNMLVIFPSINSGSSMFTAQHQLLDSIFSQLVDIYHAPRDKFIIGGFSGGAMLALSYAERANKNAGSTYIKPLAVFGVDPPLDYARLWTSKQKDIERNFSPAAVSEAKWIIDMYMKEFGGAPDNFPDNYHRYSIYSHGKPDGGNAKYLVNTPILLFTEPDIIWAMHNRRRDYYDLNCVDIAAMINMLQQQGNKKAEMIVTQNRGRRLNGVRHPHSWSIMDANAVMDWMFQQFTAESK